MPGLAILKFMKWFFLNILFEVEGWSGGGGGVREERGLPVSVRLAWNFN
jgi:hypothetical protein